MGIAPKSKPSYERSTKRYHEFCTIEDIDATNIASIGTFLNFLHFRKPKEELIIAQYTEGSLPKDILMTSSLWVIASHIKSYFNLFEYFALEKMICRSIFGSML
jgi:hypothetical protein